MAGQLEGTFYAQSLHVSELERLEMEPQCGAGLRVGGTW